jgi:hypothetical protein
MRILPCLLFLPLLALPARAEPPPAAQPVASQPAPHHHARGGWEQHFKDANTSHDGHLTLEQARQGYKTVARHFHDIDAANKGFVTEDDIRTWHAQQRAARHAPRTSMDGGLRPRPAVHRSLPGERTFDAPTQPAMPVQGGSAPTTTQSAEATH